jgi:16S rRNA A1518/A1519 N6-dimethyltransferase RsmA/KsgA/DIM1 with predicted DNA glycosylase/AP lyase activity
MELFEALDNMVIQTRFSNEGAFNTQSSKERFVQLIFNNVPLTEKDVFVDVGCGVGKVLSMLHSYYKNIIGVEIDPIIAELARNRVKDMDNVKVVTGNILDCKTEIKLATVFYLFNPFNSAVLDSFLTLVERVGRKDVRIIYSNDIYKQVFEQHHWEMIPYKQFVPLEKTGGISVWKQKIHKSIG